MNAELIAGINWMAVAVAALAYFMLGALWYGMLFQKQWVDYQGIDINDPEIKKGPGGVMAFSFLLMLVATIGLALLAERMDLQGGVVSGIKLGLLTGLCFSFTTISITYLYVKKPAGLHFIDGMYHVIGQVLAAIILCLWR